MLRRLYNWTLDHAGRPHALAFLAAISFTESSFFPIPPDALMIPMILAAPTRAWWIATVCLASSVAGGWAGYAIGYFLFEMLAKPVLEFYHYTEKFESFRQLFNEYGVWIILIKGPTPFPYKVITIAAGVAEMDFVQFTLASIVSRSMRFFLVAWLLWKYGAPIRDFIDRRLGLVTSVVAVILIALILALKFLT